jgi:hypothetical protein
VWGYLTSGGENHAKPISGAQDANVSFRRRCFYTLAKEAKANARAASDPVDKRLWKAIADEWRRLEANGPPRTTASLKASWQRGIASLRAMHRAITSLPEAY